MKTRVVAFKYSVNGYRYRVDRKLLGFWFEDSFFVTQPEAYEYAEAIATGNSQKVIKEFP